MAQVWKILIQRKVQNTSIFTYCDLGILSPFAVNKSDVDAKNKDRNGPNYMVLGSVVKVVIHFLPSS
jgi:hypothetical protein